MCARLIESTMFCLVNVTSFQTVRTDVELDQLLVKHICVTFDVELLQYNVDLLLEILKGADETGFELFFVFRQSGVTVNQHLLKPNPLVIQIFSHDLNLQAQTRHNGLKS